VRAIAPATKPAASTGPPAFSSQNPTGLPPNSSRDTINTMPSPAPMVTAIVMISATRETTRHWTVATGTSTVARRVAINTTP
jgi:hypothetical protein